jgi:hypothetical protein
MSYHEPNYCVPRHAVLRLQPSAAGPLYRELVTTSGPARRIPFSYDRGLLVIDPRYDRLPAVGPGWEPKVV